MARCFALHANVAMTGRVFGAAYDACNHVGPSKLQMCVWATIVNIRDTGRSLNQDARLTAADGHAERIAALSMIEPRANGPRAVTLGADKAHAFPAQQCGVRVDLALKDVVAPTSPVGARLDQGPGDTVSPHNRAHEQRTVEDDVLRESWQRAPHK